MGWSAIRAKIKTKLDGLVTSGSLGSVYNGEQNPQNVEFSAYPAAVIIRTQSEPEFFTNREDIQTYIFTINVYQQIVGDDWHTQEIALDDPIDAVIQAFLNDASLTGSVDGRIQPIANGGSVISWNGKMHRLETITLRCKKITAMA
ncbi:MAG: hypothetical protein WC764_04415 [Candidatus Paceibacterota bacterium]|jgi:hypothetical protein